MQARKFEHFLKQLSALTRRQRERLLGLLVPAVKRDETAGLIEQCTAQELACPGCGSRHFHKHGRAHGLQRYRCRACGRTGQTLDRVPGKGPVTRKQLHEHVKARLEPDVLLVTDSHAAYRSFAREAGITHEAVKLQAGIRVRGAIHVHNVNACHSRLRGWLQAFHGVASRYLGNYLGWRRALDGGRIKTPDVLLRAALGAGRPAAFHT